VLDAKRSTHRSRQGRHGSALAYAVLAITAVGLLGGCARRGGDIPYAPPNFTAPDPPGLENLAYDWPLGPLDVVRVTVFQVPELSGEFQVDERGFLDLPLIGAVDVRQQRPEQLSGYLEKTYGARYLNVPDVTVRLMASNNRSVTVDGGVKQPGVLQLNAKTSLLAALARAGGIDNEYGNPRRVAIFRKVNGQTMAAAFDVISIRRGEMEDPIVYPGDTIIVESNQLRGIYRELLQTLPILAIFNPL
jgi:polysaccharide biosynthesis/export protein